MHRAMLPTSTLVGWVALVRKHLPNEQQPPSSLPAACSAWPPSPGPTRRLQQLGRISVFNKNLPNPSTWRTAEITASADNPLDDDMAATTLVPRSLPDLPFEIWRMVVWDRRLSQHDIQALRPTCRALDTVAATRLFYSISISKLNTDREAFLAICRSPHLALHVHQVEWLEISYDVDLFDHIANNFGIQQSEGCREDDTAALCSYFDEQAKTLFWMTNEPSRRSPVCGGESVKTARENAAAEFRDTFMTAVDMLPNLHTFISRPMSSTRIINSDPEYPMNAALFQRFQDWPILTTTMPETNDGLVCFLAPAMARSSSTITRLRWADEFPGFSYFRPLPATAFERLESVELCFTPLTTKFQPAIATLRNLCSFAAPTLRHLKLCEEHGRISGRNPNRSAMMSSELARSPICNLRSLSLVGTKCTTDDLFGIIQANANSLRHLYIENVIVHMKLIPRLAQLTGLKLKTMTVVDDVSECRAVVCGRALVRYVNGDQPCQDCGWHEEGYPDTGVCDPVLYEWLKWSDPDDPRYQFVTCPLDFDVRGQYDPDCGSDGESEASEDSVDRRQLTAPKWAWCRFIPADKSLPSGVYCFQVPGSDRLGHRTECWKFTSRSGEIAHGEDPFDWFEDWDPDKGDLEEPTPYCAQLRLFHCRGEEFDEECFGRIHSSDETSTAWALMEEADPPAGAFYYDDGLDPTFEDDSDLDDWDMQWHLNLLD